MKGVTMSNISIRFDPDPLDIAALEQRGVEFELSDHILTMDEDSYQNLLDVAKHGATGGYGGFIYHSELYEFVCKNQEKLVEALRQDASDLGEGLFEFIKNFNFLRQNYDSSDFGDLEVELAKTLFGTPDIELGTINSVLGWYALERIAYKVEGADIVHDDDDDNDEDDDDNDDDDSKD